MDSLFLLIIGGVLLFNFVILLFILDNRRSIPRLGHTYINRNYPSLAVLVPARNEARGIAECLSSLINQDYPDFKIFVLNDFSTDGTGEILDRLSRQHPQISLVPACPLPEGWLGKNWACHQLSAATHADLLLFTDADTIHHRRSISDGVALLRETSTDMLSAIPREVVGTWAEKLTIPILVWILGAVLPHRLARSLALSQLSGAIGQYIIVTREAYEKIGGHERIRDKVADDLVLARRVKSSRLRWLMADGSERIRCRMYQNWPEVRDGLGKNLFAVFEHRILYYVFAWLWLLITAWLPLALMLVGLFNQSFSIPLMFASLLSSLISLVSWWLVLRRFNIPSYLAMAHPIIFLISAYLAALSAARFWNGHAVWKDRQLPRKVIS